MKNFLIYFSGVLYSTKECLKTWKMPKKYPILVFILSFFIMLSPIQFNMASTKIDELLNQIPNIQNVLKDVAIDLHDKNIEVEIKDNKIVASKEYVAMIDGYKVMIGVTFEKVPEVIETKPSDTDNLIVFSIDRFYARYIERTDLGILKDKGESVLSGFYNKTNNFNFNSIYEAKDSEIVLKNEVGTLLKTIYLTNTAYNMVVWIFIIEMTNLLFMLIGGFILLFFNGKGNRDYKLTYGQSFLTIMGSTVFPSMIASIIGMISFSWFTLSYIFLAFVRLFMLCYAQISKNEKYNQIEKIETIDETELNFNS